MKNSKTKTLQDLKKLPREKQLYYLNKVLNQTPKQKEM